MPDPRIAMYPAGLYGAGMHQYVCDEAELGERVAACLDDEQAMPGGFVADAHYAAYVAAEAVPGA